MAEIKSAYEKAMERYKDIEPDKQSLLKKETMDRGRSIFANLMNGEALDIKKELENVDPDKREWLKDGLGDALLSRINLPSNENDINQIDIIKAIVISIAPQAAMSEQLLKQYKKLCEQYLEAKQNLAEQMQAQYLQMMRQQGQQGSAMDPNFIKAMQKQLKDLEEQFKPAIQKVKQNLRQLCGFALEK